MNKSSFLSEDFGYLFDKDFYSIQDYIQSFNDGITTVNPDEIANERDLLEQLTFQVKMYGTKIIELYDALDQQTACTSSSISFDHSSMHTTATTTNPRISSSHLDAHWRNAESTLEDLFSRDVESACDLMQKHDYDSRVTTNHNRYTIWLRECLTRKDKAILRIYDALPQAQQVPLQSQPLFFGVSRIVQQSIQSLERNNSVESQQLQDKIDYLNEQIAELLSTSSLKAQAKQSKVDQQQLNQLQEQLQDELQSKDKYLLELHHVYSSYQDLQSKHEALTKKRQDQQNSGDSKRVEEASRRIAELEEYNKRISSESQAALKEAQNRLLDMQQSKDQVAEKLSEMTTMFYKQKESALEAVIAQQKTEAEVKELLAKVSRLEEVKQQQADSQTQSKIACNPLIHRLVDWKQNSIVALELEESVKNANVKYEQAVRDNKTVQDKLDKCLVELNEKSEVVSALQDELFAKSELLSAADNAVLELEQSQQETIHALDSENGNLKHALRDSEQELNDCKATIHTLNVQFERFKAQQVEKMQTFSSTIGCIKTESQQEVMQQKETHEKQQLLYLKEISQLKQSLKRSEELIGQYENAACSGSALNSKRTIQQQLQFDMLGCSQMTQQSDVSGTVQLGSSQSGQPSHSSNDMLDKLAKYKMQIIQLKDKLNKANEELALEKKTFADSIAAQKALEAKYIALQTEHAGVKLNAIRGGSQTDVSEVVAKIEALELENKQLRSGIFCKDNTFRELEKLMRVNESLMQELDTQQAKVHEMQIEREYMGSQIKAAHHKIDELSLQMPTTNKQSVTMATVTKGQANSTRSSSSNTHRGILIAPSNSTYQTPRDMPTADRQQLQQNSGSSSSNSLSKVDLETLLHRKNSEINRLNTLVKQLGPNSLNSGDGSSSSSSSNGNSNKPTSRVRK